MPLSEDTLEKIMAQFPTFEWSDRELRELVSPRQGIITGFQQILTDIRKLTEIDLGSIGPDCHKVSRKE